MMEEMNYTWQEIYDEWKMISNYIPTVNERLFVNKVKINHWNREGEYFHGLDWILNEDFDKRIDYVANRTDSFVMFGDCLNKGTLTTLEYLINTQDRETRAAIWIYAFIRDATERIVKNWCGDGYRVVQAIESACLLYLKKKKLEWHPAMKKLLPEICFSYQFLNAVKVEDKRIFLELAVLAADYIQMHYKVAEYDSRFKE